MFRTRIACRWDQVRRKIPQYRPEGGIRKTSIQVGRWYCVHYWLVPQLEEKGCPSYEIKFFYQYIVIYVGLSRISFTFLMPLLCICTSSHLSFFISLIVSCIAGRSISSAGIYIASRQKDGRSDNLKCQIIQKNNERDPQLNLRYY